ncbi:CDP-glycerol:poly(glycerophosphate) glycerophosphotransferase [Flavobacterium sp. 270]|uniref:CDP-glycerol glycerophosphotransferase family protein n=1 Tax=Flavobacterium sp. 270 TaxID=2512114 RepID=UPI001064FDBC|nr:CDP-glycerol glycerophosphotransferase family protein [Flavobacterium sp. 270]TDW47162.1 CDP-glycerol:poly(glycerophosphate) glycerophosphotransferase [Flavobacterium sp. 270]
MEENNNKILLLFPDGVGVRNYLYSEVFKEIKDNLILFHNFDPETIKVIKEDVSIGDTITIPVYNESIKEKFLRELICLSRLYSNAEKVDNKAVLAYWNWNQKTFSKKIFYNLIQRIAPFLKNYAVILKLERKYQKLIRQNPFYDEVKVILKKVQPRIVFCSHQRSLKAATIFAAAKDLGITTTTVIYSWDNLPKARMALLADNYLVWSEYMKKEMELYYPEVSRKCIHITGSPQFEFYEDENNIIKKETFYKEYDLDPNKKIICFSGDDTLTSPDDPSYLKDIAQEITKANLQDEYQILLRRCPVDFSGRFESVVNEYKDLIKEATPLWHFNSSKHWSAIYPYFDDVKLLVSTAFYSDIVVNVGSTMAFDFAMFNKPCIFINYDQENKNVKDWSVKTIYQFQHFRSMPNNNTVVWLNSKEEIIEKVIIKKSCSLEMNQWKEIVLDDYKRASKKIQEIIKIN